MVPQRAGACAAALALPGSSGCGGGGGGGGGVTRDAVETSTKDARVKGGLAAPLHTAARCSTQRARYRACTMANWASQKHRSTADLVKI